MSLFDRAISKNPGNMAFHMKYLDTIRETGMKHEFFEEHYPELRGLLEEKNLKGLYLGTLKPGSPNNRAEHRGGPPS